MNIELTGRHFHLDDDIKAYTHKKLDKLLPFVEEPVDVHVILETNKLRQIAELHVTHKHGSLQAKEEAAEMHTAVLAAIETATKQGRRARKKFLDKRRRADHRVMDDAHWPVEVLDPATIGNQEEPPKVIKTEKLPIRLMTLDEASTALEASKNDFFVFLDAKSERVNVLYRRKDEHYGLIDTDL